MSGFPRLPPSLVGRLTLWAVLLLCAVIALFWILFDVAADEVSREIVDTRLVQFGDQIRGYRASRVAEGAVPAPDRPASPRPSSAPGSQDIGWIWQISEGDRVVDRSQLLRLTGTVIAAAVKTNTGEFVFGNRVTPIGPMRIAERLVDEGASGSAPVTVHYLVGIAAEQYSDDVAQHASRLRRLFLLALIPVSVAALGMLAVILLALRRDLGRLAAAIGRYEAADTQQIEGRFPQELQRLADRVNGLLQQNAMLIDRTRKYVSKIAHDINHPLAILRNGLDDERSDASLLRRQVDRMAGLVDRYASLARAIGPDSQIQRRTDVSSLLRDVAEGFAIVYRRNPLEIECECEDGLTFPVARHDLEAIVSNLVSNAHKFAESRVEIGAVRIAGGLRVWVADDGPGISPELRETALNWGRRLDEAPPGTGFGLSIVSDIVAMYSGDLRLLEANLGGLRVEVELPAAASH